MSKFQEVRTTDFNMEIPQNTLALETEHSDKIDLYFSNLSYSVTNYFKPARFAKKTAIKRNILNGLSGIAKSGELCAIMGASGAGKTSLLNILSCRINNNPPKTEIKGEFFANGKKYSSYEYPRFAAYVMQNDVLFETLTPKECLQFAANFKIKGSQAAKNLRVKELIKELRLELCQNTYVGGEIVKGISGGERKRTSIGVELITNPSLIMLDEPTSGLDSFTAFVIIALLKKYAMNGKTVIFTIHQPDSDIFQLFDRLLLLVEGKLIYQGIAKDSIAYFTKIGFSCPIHSNPSDYYMQIMHKEFDSQHCRQRFDNFFNNYDELVKPEVMEEIQNHLTSNFHYSVTYNSFSYDLWVLSQRNFKNIIRNPILFVGKLAQSMFLAFVCGSIYFQLDTDPDNFQNIYNRDGALFFIALNQFQMAMQGAILTFPSERAVFLKEENSKMYGVGSYFLSKNLSEIPSLLIVPTIFCLLIYWAIAFNTTELEKFAIFWLVCILQAAIGNALGLLTGSMFSDPKVASSFVPLIFVPMILFSGLFKNQDDYPAWIGWIEYISPYKYAFEALCVNEYTGLIFRPDPLKLLGFKIGMWNCIYILIAFAIGYRIMAYSFLKALTKRLQ